MGNGLTDHDLLMEVRDDVRWIKSHLGAAVSRKEFYGVLAVLVGVFAFLN